MLGGGGPGREREVKGTDCGVIPQQKMLSNVETSLRFTNAQAGLNLV